MFAIVTEDIDELRLIQMQEEEQAERRETKEWANDIITTETDREKKEAELVKNSELKRREIAE